VAGLGARSKLNRHERREYPLWTKRSPLGPWRSTASCEQSIERVHEDGHVGGMIHISPRIAIDESEIEERFIRASGPGGQHVNKAATAVQLRFDAAHSPALPEDVRRRLMKLAGHRMTQEGVLVIEASRFRSQSRNRHDALSRLIRVLRQAARRPSRRRDTRPTRASQERRLRNKRQRRETKRLRRPPRRE
jgi:ribosome-associated protein